MAVQPSNPFSEQGVSQYPPAAPLVGQLKVYERIQDLLKIMLEEKGSCFRAVYGDWGIGKTRLAHELIASACDKSRGWIVPQVDGHPKRTTLLAPLEKSGILPVYVTFADILQAREEGIELHTALPKAVCVALKALAKAEGYGLRVIMAQDLQKQIRGINPLFSFEQLHYSLQDNTPYESRARKAFEYIQQNTAKAGQPGITRLLVIIDEVETASEFTPANTAEERRTQEYPVEAMDIKTLFSAIKEEAGQTSLPGISFMLLCSPGVRRVATIEANERRLKEAVLEKATGEDLHNLLHALTDEGYAVNFPGDLARAAFFAADRNFGWFSYIMFQVYHQLQSGSAPLQDYEFLQQVSSRIGKIVKPGMVEDLSEDKEFKDHLQRVVYHQLPASPHQLGIPEQSVEKLLDYTHPYGIKVIGEVYPVQMDSDRLIRALIEKGYREESAQSTRLLGQGSEPFEPRDLLARFSTFAGPQPGVYLVYTSLGEFANQIRFLTPDDLSDETIMTLQAIFLSQRLPGSVRFIAPTVTFLQKFNQRWAGIGASVWLPDQTWEMLDKRIKEMSASQTRQRICVGAAKTLYSPLPAKTNPIPKVKSQHLITTLSDSDILSVTQSNSLVILYAYDPSETLNDLVEIRKNYNSPTLLIFASDEKLRAWRSELAVQHQSTFGVMAIPRVIEVASREHEYLLRYSFRDDPDGFSATEVRERGSQQRQEYQKIWQSEFNNWFEALKESGYLLKPLTDNISKYNNLRKAYPRLAAGDTKEQIATMDGGAALRSSIDDIFMQYSSGNTLQIFSNQFGLLYFPNIFARILDKLETPLKPEDLANMLVYQKQNKAGFNSPKHASVVVEQILGLLSEIGLVEKSDDGKFAAVDAQSLGRKLTKARNQLGESGATPSNYFSDVHKFSEPFKQLAFKLGIGEARLKLLSDELDASIAQLKNLDLNSQKKVPAQQEAFLNVASQARQVSRSAKKVFDGTKPPEIDPNTISEHIQKVAADSDYTTYSVEYRLDLLRNLQKAIEEKKLVLIIEIGRIRAELTKKYSLNKDGSRFPLTPLTRILDIAEQDIKEQAVALPAELKTEELGANLNTYMLAGEMDKAFKRLNRYTSWLPATIPGSYPAQFISLYQTWQGVIELGISLSATKKNAEEYFEGDPDQNTWLPEEYMRRAGEQLDYLQDFANQFEETYPNPTLANLQEETKSSREILIELNTQLAKGLQDGKNEITSEITSTSYSPLLVLCQRLKQLARVSDNTVWSEKQHILQHTAVQTLEQNARKRGAELLGGDPNWFEKYLEVYKDYRAGAKGDYLAKKYSPDVLKQLEKFGAIKLEIQVNIEL